MFFSLGITQYGKYLFEITFTFRLQLQEVTVVELRGKVRMGNFSTPNIFGRSVRDNVILGFIFSLIYYLFSIFSFPMQKCLRHHSCMSFIFSV